MRSINWNIEMRLLVILLCLSLSVNAFSQSKDSTHVDRLNKFKLDSVVKANKSLIVIDGIIYNGNLQSIKPDDIFRADLLTTPGATNIFGPRAAGGAILITTRKYQEDYDRKHAKPSVIASPSVTASHSVTAADSVFIIDGNVSDNKTLKKINPNDVLSLDVLKSTDVDGHQNKPTVIITTKPFAIQTYKNKFSALCKDYKVYLKNNSNDDSALMYFIDGNIYLQNSKTIETLYKIPAAAILKVSLGQLRGFEIVDIEIKK